MYFVFCPTYFLFCFMSLFTHPVIFPPIITLHLLLHSSHAIPLRFLSPLIYCLFSIHLLIHPTHSNLARTLLFSQLLHVFISHPPSLLYTTIHHTTLQYTALRPLNSLLHPHRLSMPLHIILGDNGSVSLPITCQWFSKDLEG